MLLRRHVEAVAAVLVEERRVPGVAAQRVMGFDGAVCEAIAEYSLGNTCEGIGDVQRLSGRIKGTLEVEMRDFYGWPQLGRAEGIVEEEGGARSDLVGYDDT